MKKNFLVSTLALFGIATVAQAQNLLENAGFEDWSEGYAVGWKANGTVSSAPKDVIKITAPSNVRSGEAAVGLNVQSGKTNTRLSSKELSLSAGTYTFSVYVKSKNASETVKLGHFDTKGSGAYIYDTKELKVNNKGWTKVAYTFTLAEASNINLIVNNQLNLLYVDDAELVLTDNTVTALSPISATASSLDRVYDLSGRTVTTQKKGLLIVNGQKRWQR